MKPTTLLFKIRFIFKSGVMMDFWCSDFKYTKNSFGDVKEMSIIYPEDKDLKLLEEKGFGEEAKIRPLVWSVEEISTVWQIDSI